MLKDYLAIIGQGAAPYRDALAALCGGVLVLPPCRSMDSRVASHPDMLMMAIGRNAVVPRSYAEQADVQPILDELCRACGVHIVLTDRSPGRTYPEDVVCNGLVFGGALYGKLSCLAPEIVRFAADRGMDTIDVRQGYTGCSALACGDILLTADPSILRAVRARTGDVLAIASGGINLPGYDTGFIGGAGGYAEGHAVFFGDVRRHPDGGRIRQVLADRGISCHTLSDGPLTDFGGIKFFPLTR